MQLLCTRLQGGNRRSAQSGHLGSVAASWGQRYKLEVVCVCVCGGASSAGQGADREQGEVACLTRRTILQLSLTSSMAMKYSSGSSAHKARSSSVRGKIFVTSTCSQGC